MKNLLILSFCGAILLLTVAPLAAQNSVDVLNNGPQPTNTAGCAVNPRCIPAVWSTTSNAGTDISSPITASFVFDTNGGALPIDFPSATSGQICLADTRDLTGTTLFAQIAANCQAARGVALLLIRDSAATAPSTTQHCRLRHNDRNFQLPDSNQCGEGYSAQQSYGAAQLPDRSGRDRVRWHGNRELHPQ